MGMRWYTCSYPARPDHISDSANIVGNYASYIWANSYRHAKTLAKRRGIGEIVVGERGGRSKKSPYPLTSELLSKRSLTQRQKLDAIHSATFLSYLLMQSTDAPACDIVGDEGLLHQVIHSILFGSPRRKDMIGTLRWFEARVPGYLSKWSP